MIIIEDVEPIPSNYNCFVENVRVPSRRLFSVSKYVIVGKGVGFCDVRFVGKGILVCFDRVGTNRYCHWRLEQGC